jgi:hypothetical protein
MIIIHRTDPYRTRRMDRNDPKSDYANWQKQRQKYLDSRSELEVFIPPPPPTSRLYVFTSRAFIGYPELAMITSTSKLVTHCNTNRLLYSILI